MFNKSYKVAIIGFGYVGEACYRFFKDHYDCVVYDPKFFVEERVETSIASLPVATLEQINSQPHVAIVCVPTPLGENGECDTSIIKETIENLRSDLIVIKSTVPPGFTESLGHRHVVFSPEYIGEGKYEVQWWKDRGYPHATDMKKHNFFIFGGEKFYTKKAVNLWQRVTGPDPQYIQTTSKLAELTKYMINTWGAMKVTFCHEWYKIAEAFGEDYESLRELFLLDGRTERMHTAVFEGSKGFDGKCFPKDLSAIIYESEKVGYKPRLLSRTDEVNKENHDT